MIEEAVRLEFSERQEEAIVGYMLRDYSFFLKCHAHVPYGAFREPILSSAVKALYEFYERMPAPGRFKFEDFDGYLVSHKYASDMRALGEIRRKLDLCKLACDNLRFDLLAAGMTEWIRIYKTKNLIYGASDVYNKKDYSQAIQYLKDGVRAIEFASFDSVQAVDFMKYEEIQQSKNVDMKRRCTIGDQVFDLLLSGEKISAEDDRTLSTKELRQKYGSLVPGDVTVLIGPTNAGKTTFLTTVISQNMGIDRKVLYITHEQKYEDIVEKVVQAILGITKEEARVPATAQRVYQMKPVFDNITYWPYIKSGEMYVENVIPQIRFFQEEAVARTGRGYDLLVVDYPGKLKSKIYLGKKSSTHDETGYVYEQFMDAAKEFRMHAILAAQTNREGFKVNRGDSDRNLDAADIGKSFDISTMADNIITINRSDEDIQHKRVRFHVPKSRSSEKGWTFISTTAYHLSRTHGFGMRSTKVTPGQVMSPATLNDSLPVPEDVVTRKKEEP